MTLEGERSSAVEAAGAVIGQGEECEKWRWAGSSCSQLTESNRARGGVGGARSNVAEAAGTDGREEALGRREAAGAGVGQDKKRHWAGEKRRALACEKKRARTAKRWAGSNCHP